MYTHGQGQQAYSYAAANLGISMNNIVSAALQTGQTMMPPQPVRTSAGFGNKDRLSNDTSSKDPELLKARIFIGNLNSTQCSRTDLIDLCQPYGNLKALSLLKGYAFVQYETQTEAEMAIKILSGYNFFNQKLGSAISATSTTGPIRRPKTDFLFGGQRIRVETTNVRNRTFSQDVSPALKDINFHDHGKDDTIICGSCRTVSSNIKDYIEHRRKKKCEFFIKEVAPSVVSCFTCKEEFNEPWMFIQHLIHRHSINLYRGQPESDPITYLQQYKAIKEAANGESKLDDKEKPVSGTNGINKEQEKPVETNQMEVVSEDTSTASLTIVQEPITAPNVDSFEKNTPPTKEPVNVTQQNLSPSLPEHNDKEVRDETNGRSPNEFNRPMEDVPSYSSAVSIGVSAKNPTNYMSGSSMFIPSMVAPAPSFHVQMANTFRPQQPPPQIHAYQFTQPIPTAQPTYSNYAPMTSSMYQQQPIVSAPQISLPQFMQASAPETSNQGGLSEEEQLRMLQEFALDNM